MKLQTRVQNMISFESTTQKRALAKPESIPILMRNLVIAIPDSMAALTPRITPLLASGTDREAVMAADLLQMQLSAPSMPIEMRVDILTKLLDAVATGSEPVRLRITSALQEVAAAAMQLPAAAAGHSRVVAALRQRLLDPAAAVRVAAVRGLGELCVRAGDHSSLQLDSDIESNTRTKMIQGLVERLRDCVIDVREAVRIPLSCVSGKQCAFLSPVHGRRPVLEASTN